jgi:hypothetical protein
MDEIKNMLKQIAGCKARQVAKAATLIVFQVFACIDMLFQ